MPDTLPAPSDSWEPFQIPRFLDDLGHPGKPPETLGTPPSQKDNTGAKSISSPYPHQSKLIEAQKPSFRMGTSATTEETLYSDWPRSHARVPFPKACMSDACLLRAKTHHPIQSPLVHTRSPLGEGGGDGLVSRRSHERLVRLHLVLLRSPRCGRCSGRVFPSQRVCSLRNFHGKKSP